MEENRLKQDRKSIKGGKNDINNKWPLINAHTYAQVQKGLEVQA